MERKTIYVFLDECVLVGGLVKNFQKKNLEENLLKDSQKSHIESFKSLKNFCNYLEKSMYKIPVKLVSFETSLKKALKKIEGKEYKGLLDSEKMENFYRYLQKRKYSQRKNAKFREQNEYSIKIDGIYINIVREKCEKEYQEIFNRKYRNFSEILFQSVDKDDTNYIKTILSYSQRKNGKGIYIFLTNDKRIIKNFSTIFNELLRKKIYILDPENLNRFPEKMEELFDKGKNLIHIHDIYENMKILSYEYIYKSINKNKKRNKKNEEKVSISYLSCQ